MSSRKSYDFHSDQIHMRVFLSLTNRNKAINFHCLTLIFILLSGRENRLGEMLMVIHLESKKTKESNFLNCHATYFFLSHSCCHHAVDNNNSKWTVRKEPQARILTCCSLTHVCAAGSALASSHRTVGGTTLAFWEKGNVVTLLVQASTKANGRGRRKES